MLRSLILAEEAENDIDLAQQWYETQRMGLGDEFLYEIGRSFESIISNPFLYGYYNKGNIRRFIINKFPYIILYVVSDEQIEVLSVFHTQRNPIA